MERWYIFEPIIRASIINIHLRTVNKYKRKMDGQYLNNIDNYCRQNTKLYSAFTARNGLVRYYWPVCRRDIDIDFRKPNGAFRGFVVDSKFAKILLSYVRSRYYFGSDNDVDS